MLRDVTTYSYTALRVRRHVNGTRNKFAIESRRRDRILPLVHVLLTLKRLVGKARGSNFVRNVRAANQLIRRRRINVTRRCANRTSTLTFTFERSITRLTRLNIRPVQRKVSRIRRKYLNRNFTRSNIGGANHSPVTGLYLKRNSGRIVTGRTIRRINLLARRNLGATTNVRVSLQ